MQKIIFTFVLSLLANYVFAQEGLYIPLQEGEKYKLIADRVNVRDEASTKGDVIAQLAIGATVTIENESSKMHTSNGYKAPWYKVSFRNDGERKEGYIWGGLIAIFYEEINGTTFLFGVEEAKDWGEHYMTSVHLPNTIIYQARTAKNGKELSKITFEGIGTFSTLGLCEVFDNKGLNSIDNIVMINFSDGFCAGAFGEIYLFIDDNKLYHARTNTDGLDAPCYYEEELIFPNEENGIAGKLRFTTEGGCEEEYYNEETGEYEYEGDIERTETIYLWNNGKLVKE